MSPEAIHGTGGAYVPCLELAAELPPLPAGAIVGQAAGFVAKDEVAAGLPETPQGAIRGSQVGFVPAPCECTPVGNGQGVFKAYRRFTPVTTTILNGLDQILFPPRPAIIEDDPNVVALGDWHSGLAADGRGREGAIQFTIPALMILRVNIEVYIDLAITFGPGHPRCYTNIPIEWELRRANFGASFTPTHSDLQLDPNGAILGGGTVTPAPTLCYPLTLPSPEHTFHLLSYTDDLAPDVNGKIQFQLRVADLNAPAAYEYNNDNYGDGFYSPFDDEYLYAHSLLRTTVTVCEP